MNSKPQLVAVGWTFVTPRYNFFKRFFWENKKQYPFAAFSFPKRLVANLHDAPVFEYERAAEHFGASGMRAICMTINNAAADEAATILAGRGVAVEGVDKFLLSEFRSGALEKLQSPFESIPFSRMKGGLSLEATAGFRLFSQESYDLYRLLRDAWTSFRWDHFYDAASPSDTEDKHLSTLFERLFASGVYDYVVHGSNATLAVDVLMSVAPMFHSGNVRVFLHDERCLGRRFAFYRAMLAERLSIGGSPSAPVCLVSDNVSDVATWVSANQDTAARAHMIVGLPGSLYDLKELEATLNAYSLSHRIALKQVSADPSKLIASLTPIT